MPKVLDMMGFPGLRPGGQDVIVNTLLAGVDSVCIMPTSGGKTASFIIPALCHDWRLLIFSPLKALMADQVRGLEDKGIIALSISSDQPDQINQRNLGDWLDGNCKILYVAPERLANAEFMRVMRQARPDMVAVDECHTVSAWTDSFRHNYVNIGKLIEDLRPRLVAGFTATYSKEIDADVRRVLRVPKARVLAFYPRRENLHLSSSERDENCSDIYDRVEAIDGKVLIYCDAQKRVEQLARDLSRSLGEVVGFYHAGVAVGTKKEMQANFTKGRIRIMTATNAFGMGVDIPDIRSVIHYDHPADPEALSQEIGRAGRDGLDSWCHTYSCFRSQSMCNRRIASNHPTESRVRDFFDYMVLQADSSGVITTAARKVQADLRLSDYDYPPLVQLFLGAGVLSKADGVARYHKLRFVAGKSCGSKAFAALQEAVERSASVDQSASDGTLIFDMDIMASDMGVTPQTVSKNLKGWQSDGILVYEPPGRTEPKRLTGGLDLIDFDRLEKKRKLAFKKLQTVLGYFDVDDAEKHQYLEDYFTAFTK